MFVFTPCYTLCNSKLLGVSINTSLQSIIPIKFLKHQKRSGDGARTVLRSGIKTNALKYSVIARNQEKNMLEQLTSETLNLIAKSIASSPSLNFVIASKNSSFEDNFLSFPIFLYVVINCLLV